MVLNVMCYFFLRHGVLLRTRVYRVGPSWWYTCIQCVCVTSVWLVCPPPPSAVNTIMAVSRDVYGYIAVYSCVVGNVFTEGGHVRTALCTDGHWIPATVHGCHGNHLCIFCHWGATLCCLSLTPYHVMVHCSLSRLVKVSHQAVFALGRLMNRLMVV